jgi:hypothetical protein
MIEPDKDIILYCSDFMGEYRIQGRMIKYKDKLGRLRFCTFNRFTNKFESNHKEWSQREGWEYKAASDKGE